MVRSHPALGHFFYALPLSSIQDVKFDWVDVSAAFRARPTVVIVYVVLMWLLAAFSIVVAIVSTVDWTKYYPTARPQPTFAVYWYVL